VSPAIGKGVSLSINNYILPTKGTKVTIMKNAMAMMGYRNLEIPEKAKEMEKEYQKDICNQSIS